MSSLLAIWFSHLSGVFPYQKPTMKELMIENIWVTSPKNVGSFHHGQVHRPIAIQGRMRIAGAKVGVHKEWAKFCTRRRELQTVNFNMTEHTVKRSILTVLCFSRWGKEIAKQDQKLNRHENFLFRPILITVSVRIPKCHRTQVSQSFGELQVSQCGTPSQRTSSQTRSQAETRRQETHQPHAHGWRSATESPWTLWHTGGSRQGPPRYTSASTEGGRGWPETQSTRHHSNDKTKVITPRLGYQQFPSFLPCLLSPSPCSLPHDNRRDTPETGL